MGFLCPVLKAACTSRQPCKLNLANVSSIQLYLQNDLGVEDLEDDGVLQADFARKQFGTLNPELTKQLAALE